jgi:hypothetical protein
MTVCEGCLKEVEDGSTSLTIKSSEWLCPDCLDSYCEEHGNYGVCVDPDAWKYELRDEEL